MLFKSQYPDIDGKCRIASGKYILTFLKVPSTVPVWDYLFDAKSQYFKTISENPIKGFRNTQTNQRLAHLQVKDYSTWISTALARDHGLREGDVVSICSPNSVWYPVSVFAVMRAGGLSALSSPGYTENEMVHVLKTVGCRFIMTSISALEVVVKTAKRLGIDQKRIFLLDGQVEGFKSVLDLLDDGKRRGESQQVEPFKLPVGKSNREVCTILCFSSGTTGLPKAVS
jgi:4-coumarate--CoA ligase